MFTFLFISFQHEIHDGKALGFTVFHDCVIPPDDFVANCRIIFEDLKPKAVNDIWVDLEPHGQLHLMIELQGSFTEGQFASSAFSNIFFIISLFILKHSFSPVISLIHGCKQKVKGIRGITNSETLIHTMQVNNASILLF